MPLLFSPATAGGAVEVGTIAIYACFPPMFFESRRRATMTEHDPIRRNLLRGAAVAASFAAVSTASAQNRSDNDPRELNGQPVPEPAPEQSAGPIRPGRGTVLTDKIAVVTGAARGIGRAIAVEMAANGADVVALDIVGPVSTASNAVPATPEELDETVRQIRGYGRRADGIKADIRVIAALRTVADHVEQTYGKIDIVVANAAIQRWIPLLEMEDADWRDVIDNNLNGTANTVRAFAPKMVARKKGRLILLSSMQGKHGTKDAASYSASKWGILGLMKSAALELGEHHRQRPDPRARRHRAHSLRQAAERNHRRDRPAKGRASVAAKGLGYSCADSASESRLAAAGRHFTRGRVPGFGRRQHGHRRRIRGYWRRQRQGHLRASLHGGSEPACEAAVITHIHNGGKP
jgi:NAD(P)-dependent dehydrogenase (short-subunit alcohol dehydrogenase family)